MAKSIEALREHLLKHSIPEPNTGCWLWLRCVAKKFGYGRINTGDRQVYTHRVSYEVFRGSITEGLFVLHSCDTPSCINPGHLRLGTKQENTDDAKRRKRGLGKRSRFTQEQADSMVRRLLAGESPRELALEHGVTEDYMQQMRRGRRVKNARRAFLPQPAA